MVKARKISRKGSKSIVVKSKSRSMLKTYSKKASTSKNSYKKPSSKKPTVKKATFKKPTTNKPIVKVVSREIILPPAKSFRTDVNVVAALQDIQAKDGFLSIEALARLSKEDQVPGVDIYGVATFYNQFKLSKSAKYVISICRGTACHVMNSGVLLEQLEKMLNIKAGQSTKDGLITLEIVRCIGACAKAPAIMVNDKVYGNVTEEKLKEIVGGLR